MNRSRESPELGMEDRARERLVFEYTDKERENRWNL
jgi:hypothetical protein